MANNILIEVCCGSLDDALEAQKAGADRIELNSALFLGGLTPSIGTLMETRKQLEIPIMAMVRPRGGGFCYTQHEFTCMEQDVEMAVEYGADGVVFGILKDDGTIDMRRCKRLIDRVGDRESIFHRAFDVVPDPFGALEQLIDLGVKRVMTSGQQRTVYEGTVLIKKLIEHADGRIEILPGGGIRLNNVDDIVSRTDCQQIHVAPFAKHSDYSTSNCPHIYFGGALYPPEDSYQIIDRSVVEAYREKLMG